MIVIAALVALVLVHALYMIAEHQLLHGPVRKFSWWRIVYDATHHLRYWMVVVVIMLGLAHCFS